MLFMDFEFSNDNADTTLRTFTELIEIGICVYNDESHHIIFHDKIYVHPEHNIPERIQKLTGITNETVKNARSISRVMQNLKDLIETNDIITTYGNCDAEDLTVCLNHIPDTHKESRKILTEMIQKIVPYTYTIGGANGGKVRIVSLEAMANACHLSRPNHDAMNDAITLCELVNLPADKLPSQSTIRRYYTSVLKARSAEKAKEAQTCPKKPQTVNPATA